MLIFVRDAKFDFLQCSLFLGECNKKNLSNLKLEILPLNLMVLIKLDDIEMLKFFDIVHTCFPDITIMHGSHIMYILMKV